MNAPYFSIVVPTRNRPALARACIRKLLDQTSRDFEVLVMENSDQNCLTLDEFDRDERIRLLPSSSVLNMPDNWERALDYARGAFITYISDKDLLVPTALEEVRDVADRGDVQIVNYRKSLFASETGTLSVHRNTGKTLRVDAKPLLAAWFDALLHYHNAPMIYNSMVRRSLLAELRARTGRFFLGCSPDISSGLLFMATRDEYTLLDRVLAVAHSGSWSNGAAVRHFGNRHPVSNGFLQEFGRDPLSELGLPTTISSALVEVLHSCVAVHPELFRGYRINWQRYVANTIDEVRTRASTAAAKRSDLEMLQGSNRFISTRTYRLGALERWAYVGSTHLPRVVRFAQKPGRRLVRGLLRRERHEGPWDDNCYLPSVRVTSIERAFEMVTASKAKAK